MERLPSDEVEEMERRIHEEFLLEAIKKEKLFNASEKRSFFLFWLTIAFLTLCIVSIAIDTLVRLL